MKNVVFKMKFNHPNKSKTPKLNVNHFSYICKRARALYNDGQNFCCFGKVSEIGYKSFGEINDFENIKEHILKKSKDKTTFYKCVISLTEEDALLKGFNKRIEWEKIINRQASKIAKNMDIKIENFEYVCSVHMEKGHPHMHFMAWDKEQEVLRTNISKNKLNNIRKSLTNYVFKDELEFFYDIKNKSKESFKADLKNSLEDIDNIFQMSSKDYKKYVEKLKSLDLDLNSSKIVNVNLNEKYIDEIMKDIFNLKKQLPKTGRLNYGFMSSEIKQHLNLISKKILAMDIQVRSSFSNYINSIKDISEFTSNSEKYIEKNIKNAEDEILRFVGNQILNICKKINAKEIDVERGRYEKLDKLYERQEMINLVSNVISFISKSENKNKSIKRNKANSIVSKKELAKKLQNKSHINWENEI